MDRAVECHKCKKSVPITELRYDHSGQYLACRSCRGEKPADVPIDKSKLRTVSKDFSSPFGDTKLLKFQCTSCHYTFRRSQVHPVKKCPNCGAEKLLKFDKVDAESIIKMTEDSRFKDL